MRHWIIKVSRLALAVVTTFVVLPLRLISMLTEYAADIGERPVLWLIDKEFEALSVARGLMSPEDIRARLKKGGAA